MANSKTIPPKDADFNVWQNIIASAATENITPWLLDRDWIANVFTPAREAWTTAWAAYANPASRTTVMTFSKNETRKSYEKLLSILVNNLKVNTRVTDDDRRALRINIPDRKPTPSPVPTTFPVATIDTSVIRRLGVHFRDSAGTTNAKPRGVHGAEIKWSVTQTLPDVGPDKLENSSFDTCTPFVLEFSEVDRGKPVCLCLRWENTRGVKGPWGDVISAIVP